jgi:hypothetical protein
MFGPLAKIVGLIYGNEWLIVPSPGRYAATLSLKGRGARPLNGPD